jgi:hypothetical protein
VPPGLVRDVARVNGFSISRDGTALSASWRVSGEPDAFVLECSAARSGASWSTDLTLRVAADAVTRSGDRASIGLPGPVGAMTRCRVAAESDGVLGVRSNAASVPSGDEDDDAADEGTGQGSDADRGRPVLPGPPDDRDRPVVPGPPSGTDQSPGNGPPSGTGPPTNPGQSGNGAPSGSAGQPGSAGQSENARSPVAGPNPNANANSGRPELDPSGRRPR